MNTRLLGLLLFVSTLFFSAKTTGQATCIAVIDNTRTEFCVGSGTVTFSNATAVGENIEWLTLGDGTFDNKFATNPTYTPGTRDRSTGYTYILLDVYKDDTVNYCSELPWVKLNFASMGATATPASQSICTATSISTIALSGVTGGTYNWTRDNTASVTGIAASGTGNISGTLTNNTGAPLTVTFSITATNGACTSTPITATVVVSPKPTATVPVSSQSICSGSTITPIVINGNFDAATYSWTRNNTSSVTGIASSGTGDITGALTKTSGLTTTTVTFTITPKLNGCSGNTVTSTVAVSPSSVAVTGTPSSQTICSGSAITTIVPSGGNGSTTYTWTRDNTSSITGIASGGSGNISGTLTNTTTAPAYTTFTITRSSSSCTNRATVLVNPAPVATATPLSQNICSGASISAINLNSNITGTTYTWTRDNTASVTGIAASGSGDITGNLVNTTNGPVTVTFTIIPLLNGCAGSPVTASVVVSANLAGADVTPLSQIICSGTSLTSINGNGSGIAYSWTRDNINTITGLAASGTGNIQGVLTNTINAAVTVTFTITPSANGCIGAPLTATAIVNPRPTAALSGSQTICSEGPAPSLSIALTGAAPWSFTYSEGTTPIAVNNVNSNPYVFTVPASAAAYSITALNDANCSAQAADITGGAVISQLNYQITASAGTNGSITPAGVTNVICGNSQTFTITANNCYQISDVLVDGVSVGAVSSYTFNNVTGAHTINATFTQLSYVIIASAGSNGTITPAGGNSISCGSNQTFTIAANSCYQITDVLVDGVSVGAVSSYTFNNVTTAHTISATFTQLNYTITASAGNNGIISPAGTNSVSCGSNQTFIITANSCYQIADVLVDGVSVGAVSSYTFNNVTTAHTISATFTQLNYTITASAGSNGIISTAGTNNVACGNSQTFTIAANSCYQIADVLVDGVSIGAVSSYTFNNVTTAHTISATFSQLSYAITASPGSNGSITPAGGNSVACGGNQTFTIAANSCYQIADVVVDGASIGAVSSYTFTNITAAHTISATFIQLSYTIAASAGNNGIISSAGTNNIACGGSQTFTITANSCYQIADVLVDGISVGAVSSYIFSNVSTAHTISATFSQIKYAINANAGSNGSISPAGLTNVNCGSSQTYTITANTGFAIQDVLVDGISAGVVSSYTFSNVTTAHTISAVFNSNTFVITANAGANGSITPAGTNNVANGANQTFIITANSCYQIADVLVDGVSVGAVLSYTFSNVTASHTISATFTQLSYAITVNAGSNGSITPNGSNSVTCGGNQTFTITANSCYQIADVLVDGISIGAVSSYTFNNVTASHTISATFTQLSYAVTASAGANGSITPFGVTNVNCGNSQTYTVTAGAGFSIQAVLVDGVSQGAISTYTFTNINASHTISASFVAAGGCTLRATAAAAAMACNGSSTTLTVTATGGTGARQYSLNGGAFQSGNSFTVTAAGSPYTVTVRDAGSCTAVTNSVTVSPAPTAVPGTPAGIDGPVYGLCSGGSFTYNVQPVATATSYVWSAPSGFSILSGQGTTQVVMSVPAGFTGSPGIWAVAKNGCGGGTGFRLAVNSVQSLPSSSITGAATVAPSQAGVQYSVPNETGSTYNWQVPTGAVISNGQGTNNITVTFGTTAGNVSVAVTNACGTGPRTNKAVNIVSNTQLTITANAGANGSITPAGTNNVANGANQTFIITANSCYQIADVLVDGVSVGAVLSYTFSNVTASHTISATFTQLSYAITVNAGSNGSITPNGSNSVTCGGNQTFTITANSCYQIADVLVDGISIGAVSSYTFNNVTASHTISATFTQLSYAVTASAGANGSITPFGVTNVNCGNSQTYTVTAGAGFSIQAVLVDGVSQGAISTYTFTNINASHTISASFVAAGGCTLRATAAAAAMACNGSSTTLTVTATGGTGARQYSLNGGAFQSGNSFTVTAAGSPYTVTVRDAGSCTAVTNSVTVSPAPTAVPGTPAGIDGPVYGLCSGGSFTYNVQPVATATSYVWSAPSGFSILSGQGTTQVVMSVPAGFTGSPGIWAVAKNGCGGGTGFRLAVNSVQSLPSSSITGAATVAPSQAGVQYSVPNETGSTYNWQVPTGAVISNGQGTNNITVTFGTTAGNVSVAVANACGTGPRTNKPVSFTLTRVVAANITKAKTEMNIYPNPVNSNATIVFSNTKVGGKFEVMISNSLGYRVYAASGVIMAGQNRLQLDLGKFKNGMYILKLVTEDDAQTLRLMKE